MSDASASQKDVHGSHDDPPHVLRLFTAGNTEVCRAAQRNLRLIVAEYLPEKSRIEVIDLLENPDEAERHAVIAIPMLVRCEPRPIRRIVGDLGDRERVLTSLGVVRDTDLTGSGN